MAVEKKAKAKAKTAERKGPGAKPRKHPCSYCKRPEMIVMQLLGAGPHGFFWVCECGFKERTR